MANDKNDHSDRDDVYPADERPYRQADFMGDSYYRNPRSNNSARTLEDARRYYSDGQNNNDPNDQMRDQTRQENDGRRYANSRSSGARTHERGRYMDSDSARGIRDRDEREVYRSDVHNYERSAGSSRGRSHLSGSDYGGQDSPGRGSSYDRYGSWDASSRAVDSDMNLGSSYGTSTSFNAGPIYGEPSNYNDGQDMGAFTSTMGVSGGPHSTSGPSQMRPTNSWGGRESYAGRGPKNYKRTDERIREDVSEVLFHHHEIDASEIEVDVKEGLITLRGEVDDRATKRLAEDIIERVSGVKDVRNELTVNKGFFARAKEMLMGEPDRPEAAQKTQGKSKH